MRQLHGNDMKTVIQPPGISENNIPFINKILWEVSEVQKICPSFINRKTLEDPVLAPYVTDCLETAGHLGE